MTALVLIDFPWWVVRAALRRFLPRWRFA